MIYQQGDVLLTSIHSLPRGASKRPGVAVLAEGEATGHSHVAQTLDPASCVELYERDGTLFLRTTGPAEIRHEEHHPFEIPAGIYRVSKVQEYDHFLEEARDVQD